MKLNNIIEQCRRNLDKHPELGGYLHWTYLLRGNEILSVGMNRKFEPSKKYGYHINPDPNYRPKLHAELDAIRRCKFGITNLTVVNVRLNHAGEIRMSMPCKACRNLLIVCEVKKVFFTTEHGWGQM